jgi:hypothetical protein
MLTEKVFVTAKTFKGDEEVCIHIEKNYLEGPKGLCPTTKCGVKLSLGQWKLLERNMDRIDETLSEIREGKDINFSLHLGANVYVKMNPKFVGVNIRHWWWCKGTNSLNPTRKGVFLVPLEWDILTECSKDIEQAIPELEYAKMYIPGKESS